MQILNVTFWWNLATFILDNKKHQDSSPALKVVPLSARMSTKDRRSRGWTDMASPSPTARYRQPSGKLRFAAEKKNMGKLKVWTVEHFIWCKSYKDFEHDLNIYLYYLNYHTNITASRHDIYHNLSVCKVVKCYKSSISRMYCRAAPLDPLEKLVKKKRMIATASWRNENLKRTPYDFNMFQPFLH